jgi:hypothetical protein
MSPAEPTHGWPVVLYRARLYVRAPGLDPFQRVVLALAAADVRDPQRIQHLTGLDHRFVEPLIDELAQRGALDRDGRPLRVGLDLLDKDGEEVAKDGFVAWDGLTQAPLPGFWFKKPPQTDRPPMAEVQLPTDQPDARQMGAWREAITRWQRVVREEGTADQRTLNLAGASVAITGVRFLGNGWTASLPVRLSVDPTGQPVVQGPLPSEILAGRLERARPHAWIDLESDAQRELRALERAKANEQNQAEVERRLRQLYREVKGRLADALREALLLRVLAEAQPNLGGATLTAYRKWSEAVAISLSPERLTAPAEAARDRLRKPVDELRPHFEALAAPDVLQVPKEIAIGDLRKDSKRPTHGVALQTWPFWHAVLDPRAPESEALRQAAQRCPSLWLELDLLRRECNAGAHASGEQVVEPERFARIDANVSLLLAAVGQGTIKPPRPVRVVPTGLPEAVARALRAADQAASRVEREPDQRRVAIDGLWSVALERLQPWQKLHDSKSFDEKLRGLPGGDRARGVVERLLDGLRSQDEDGIGYEIPRDFAALIEPAVQDLLANRKSDRANVLRPLLLAAWWPDEGIGPEVRAHLERRDPWEVLAQVHRLRVSAVRPGDQPPSDWLSSFDLVRSAVESLWISKE